MRMFEFLLFACLTGLPVPAQMRAPSVALPLRVSGIKAMLFFQNTGTFSPDVFSPAFPYALWNVPFGGGMEGKLSTATLVVVEVTGDASKNDRLIFTARYRPLNGKRSIVVTKTK